MSEQPAGGHHPQGGVHEQHGGLLPLPRLLRHIPVLGGARTGPRVQDLQTGSLFCIGGLPVIVTCSFVSCVWDFVQLVVLGFKK